MPNQFALFRQKKFAAMFGTQFFGAFNDNVFKQAVILILTYFAADKLNSDINLLNNLAALLFILPYFLFSALAGQIADNYEKSSLTQKIKLLEIIIMIFASLGFLLQWYWSLFVALFLLGTHSAFFGPIKYAYLPEIMHKDELVAANGLFQMGTSLAILTGMIAAGLLTQLSHALFWISITTLTIAFLGYVLALFIPKTHTPKSKTPITINILSSSFYSIAYLYRYPLLFFVAMGNSWFWFYGATFLTQTPTFSKLILHGNESVVIALLTLFSVGTAIGSLLCKRLSKNQLSLKLLPFGIAGLSIFAVDLYFSLSHFTLLGTIIQKNNHFFGISELLYQYKTWRIFIDLFLLGFFGGLYIVPLYALMQAYAPISHRARIVGANNIFNALFMVLSALFSIIILSVFTLSISQLFLITGVINGLFGLLLYKKLNYYKNSVDIAK